MTNQEKQGIILDFIEYCKNALQINTLPKIVLEQDKMWATTMRSFGQYSPSESSLVVYIGNRNLADILRTLAHELVHHRQNEKGMLSANSGNTGSKIEDQANSIAGILMRNYGKKNSLIYETKLITILEDTAKSRFDIYCDMDGVLCDFDAQFDHFYGITPKEYSEQYGRAIFNKAIDDAGIDFWAKMPWMEGGKDLWGDISKYGVTILSAPGFFKYAKEGKKKWIAENLIPIPKNVIFAQSKEKQSILLDLPEAQIKKSILIDDLYMNIKPWQDMGAIGITHKSYEKTKLILQKFRI